MMSTTGTKTAIITGASQGIGAAVAKTFMGHGYNIVATARDMGKTDIQGPEKLAFVNGDIGNPDTAKELVRVAVEEFGSVDILVNNAGIFLAKPFTDYSDEDVRRLYSTNIDGFVNVTRRVIEQMLKQDTGGSIVSITTSLVDNPIASVTASIPMLTKGGIDAMSRNLAMEYAGRGIRVNTVAPGVVDTPLHKSTPKDFMRTLSPMGAISTAQDIADAVLFLTEASQITGETLHVDGGAHLGKW